MTSRFAAFLFDIDGTLLRAGGAGRRAFTRAMEDLAGPVAEPVHAMKFDGMTDRMIVREALALSSRDFDAALADAILARYLEHLPGELDSPAFRVLPGAASTLGALRARGAAARPLHRQPRPRRPAQAPPRRARAATSTGRRRACTASPRTARRAPGWWPRPWPGSRRRWGAPSLPPRCSSSATPRATCWPPARWAAPCSAWPPATPTPRRSSPAAPTPWPSRSSTPRPAACWGSEG